MFCGTYFMVRVPAQTTLVSPLCMKLLQSLIGHEPSSPPFPLVSCNRHLSNTGLPDKVYLKGARNKPHNTRE